MGWSANAAACFALDYISETVSLPLGSQNALPGGGFWETSRTEHDDGAITGTVWRPVGPDRVRRAGSFRIEGDGTVTRFPRLDAATRKAAKIAADARYARTYCREG